MILTHNNEIHKKIFDLTMSTTDYEKVALSFQEDSKNI